MLNLLEEYKKPVKLSKFEYEYLKVAKKERFNFIARDKDGGVFLYTKKPTKCNLTWESRGDYECVFKSMFKFVEWEDEHAWSIDAILSNCEVMKDE